MNDKPTRFDRLAATLAAIGGAGRKDRSFTRKATRTTRGAKTARRLQARARKANRHQRRGQHRDK